MMVSLFLHQPPSPTHPPVLYYTVTHNVSDNGSELAFNTTTNKAVLNEARYGERYFISVCAVNLIGKGPSTVTTLIINGKIIVHVITRIIFVFQSALHQQLLNLMT